jgi:hypothetical protein
MSMLDLLIILAFLLLIAFAKIALTPFALVWLVIALILERFLKGERL